MIRRRPRTKANPAIAVDTSDRPRSLRHTTSRLGRRLGPELWALAGVAALSIAGVAAAVSGPALLGAATDVVFAGFISARLPADQSPTEIIQGLRADGDDAQADMLSAMTFVPGQGIDFVGLSRLLALALGVYLLAVSLQWLQGIVLNRVVQHTVLRLRADVETKIHRVPLRYFDRMPRGDLLSRVTNDMDNLSQSLQQVLAQLLTAVLTVLGVIVMMLVISPPLALIALITVPLTVFAVTMIARRSQPMFAAQWAHTGALNAQVEETYTAHDIVQAFGRQTELEDEFERINDEVYDTSYRAQYVAGTIQPVSTFIGNLVYVAIAVVGGLMVASGTLRIGAVQAFIQYARQFAQPLTQISAMIGVIQSGAASAERILAFLDVDEQPASPAQKLSPERVTGGARLVFEHVDFGYTRDTPLIKDLNLDIPAGSTVAIVGPTGAGKTTLVNLIMRFYDLTEGRITYHGVDVAQMTREDLRSRIGMVLQDTWLFEGTIWDNIAYGRPGATEEQIHAAAVAAYVDRFVHALPDGYQTVLSEGAENLSAGERQLITIARAFLAQPSVLILDEATSSVDTRTELLVQNAMKQLRTGRTSFVIAHRLSTIRDADLILVLEHGSVVEQGSHAELLRANGPYARLYRAQFTEAVTDNPETLPELEADESGVP